MYFCPLWFSSAFSVFFIVFIFAVLTAMLVIASCCSFGYSLVTVITPPTLNSSTSMSFGPDVFHDADLITAWCLNISYFRVGGSLSWLLVLIFSFEYVFTLAQFLTEFSPSLIIPLCFNNFLAGYVFPPQDQPAPHSGGGGEQPSRGMPGEAMPSGVKAIGRRTSWGATRGGQAYQEPWKAG